MQPIFSEDFFASCLNWLFVAVTLVLLAFNLLVWYFFWRENGGGTMNWFDMQRKSTATAGQEPIDTMILPGVSIIVCARNESPNLLRYLPRLLQQQYPADWEVLVVNDASSDDTGAVLASFQRQFSRLQVINILEKRHIGKKQALEAGMQMARHSCILLTDADCMPASDQWLQQMIIPMAIHPAIEIVLGYAPMKQTANGGFLERWSRFETAFTAMQYFSLAGAGMPYMGVGRNMAFRKRIFDRAGGFAGHLHIPSGDDDLLVNAIASGNNTTWCLHPSSFVYSAAKKTWHAWLRQKRRHLGAGAAYQWQHQVVLGLLGLLFPLYYFLLLLLVITWTFSPMVLIFVALRMLLLFLMYKNAFSCLREPGLLRMFIPFDGIMAVYYGAVVPILLLTAKKQQSWN